MAEIRTIPTLPPESDKSERHAVQPQVSANGAGDAQPPKPAKPEDATLALDLMQQWEGKVKIINQKWLVFEGGYWAEREDHEVKNNTWEFLERYPIRINITASRIESIVKLAGFKLSVTDRAIADLAPERARYINLRNGLYDLDSHSLQPHNRDLYFTHQLPFSYDPNAKCPNFLRYLQRSLIFKATGNPDNEMIMLLLQALGYSMTGRTDLKSSFWLVGEPDSGKSVLIALIRTLMGSLHTTLDLNQIGKNNFIMSHIVGKRVVTFTEASANSMLDDALYKAMVGGTDELWADVKGKKAITFRPEAKFWWAMNDAPNTKDRSGAIINRLRIINFPITIPHEKRIRDLDRILATEHSGIFNFAMTAYKELCETGKFVTPAQSEQWLKEYKERTDLEAAFIAECCEKDPTAFVKSRDLYNRYRDWCIESSASPKNINAMSREWKRLGFDDIRHRDGMPYYYGLKIRY